MVEPARRKEILDKSKSTKNINSVIKTSLKVPMPYQNFEKASTTVIDAVK